MKDQHSEVTLVILAHSGSLKVVILLRDLLHLDKPNPSEVHLVRLQTQTTFDFLASLE